MKTFFVFLAMAGFILISSAYANRDEGMNPADGFFLPAGDPKTGQRAFAQLKCNACHWVQNEMDLSVPVTAKPGPLLGKDQAKYSRGWLANSIISPSHTIAIDSNGESKPGALSRMGDFSETMTVRQMIDIVAYIKSLDDANEPREAL